MFGLRQKLLLGFGGLLLIMAGIGVQSIAHLSDLKQATDVILQADYQSVVACQRMKESLQLIDSGVELLLIENSPKAAQSVAQQIKRFEEALDLELTNINLPGEGEKTERLRNLYFQYKADLPKAMDRSLPETQRREQYLNVLRPRYEESIKTAEDILEMNQANMAVAGQQVKEAAGRTVQHTYIMLGACGIVSIVSFVLLRRWILQPLQTLTDCVRGIERDDLEQEAKVLSRDELAEFAKAFNAMATHLRAVRAGDQARLQRTQRTTQLALDSLPDAVLVLSPDGNIEMVNATAARLFELNPGSHAKDCNLDWLSGLWRSSQNNIKPAHGGYDSAVQIFDHGNERFFLPNLVPILDDAQRLVGFTIVLADVTQLRKLDELKSGLLSTTSHELKTPLTSLQMVIHLLLEQRVGRLEAKQVELLSAARGDVDRLRGIVDNILDLSRIESGRVRMDLQKMSPRDLVDRALEPLRGIFQNRKIALNVEIPSDLPNVWADASRVWLVFANLLSNALKYTPDGGAVNVSARSSENAVEFSISDTGRGVPEEYRERVFDKFFRVPEQDGLKSPSSGAGLGLAIAREVVLAHGGKISCEGRANRGSTFSFTLQSAESVPQGVTE